MARANQSTKIPLVAHQDGAPRVPAGGRKRPWARATPPVGANQRDGGLPLSNSDALLSRLLNDWADWLDAGLVVLARVRGATSDYRLKADPLDCFLEECVAPDPGGRVQSSTMHELFCAWAKASGVAEWSNKRMTAVLKKRGFRATKTSVMFWLAVKLTRRINDLAIPERDGSSKARRATSRRSK
jgi:putative DNA primase/helicase